MLALVLGVGHSSGAQTYPQELCGQSRRCLTHKMSRTITGLQEEVTLP